MASLHNVVMDHERSGAKAASLGIVSMPDGFALMKNPDGYFYWVGKHGDESCIHWNKWTVYKMAKQFSKGIK